MSPRVTIRHIAQRAGVHYTTVARALRNHPALPPETRERIQTLARVMGYAPDPVVSALNAYRLARQRVTFHGTIAWIDGYPQREGVSPKRPSIQHAPLFEGAEARAGEMGYKLEVFRIGNEDTPTAATLDRVLMARGVRNLIVAPQFNLESRLELNWQRYSAVAVSLSVGWPQLNLITHDHFYNITILLRKLRELGYRRPGLILERRLMEITRKRWLGGCLATSHDWPARDRVKPFVFEASVTEKELQGWWRRSRPDVIITERGFWVNRLSSTLRLRCPDDVGVALLTVPWEALPEPPFAGIRERVDRVGATAVEHLVRMEHMDARGVPESPLNTLVRGEWHEGVSVRIQT